MNHHTMKTNETDTTTATATQSTKSTVLLSIDKSAPTPTIRGGVTTRMPSRNWPPPLPRTALFSPSGCEPQNKAVISSSAENAATAPCNCSARPRSRQSSMPLPPTNGRSSTSRFRRTFSARRCRRSTRPKPTKPPCRPSAGTPPPWPHASARASSISTTG